MRNLIATLATSALVLPLLALGDGAGVPKRPEQIQFGALKFDAPDPAQFRHTLKDGTVVYLAPSHEFPLINLTMTFKGGSNLDPADMVGLAGMYHRASAWRGVLPHDYEEGALFPGFATLGLVVVAIWSRRPVSILCAYA